MPRTSAAPARAGLAALLGLAVLTPLGATGAAADVDAPPTLSQTPAEQALELAQDVMSGRSTAVSPTLALRDLAASADELAGVDRQQADALLARPNDPSSRTDLGIAVWSGNEAAKSASGGGCSTSVPVCVHWTNSGDDAPPPADIDADQVPDWVETTITTMEDVWSYEIDTLGYRRPLTDQRGSVDADGVNFDVYLSNIGIKGYYGYCTIDDSRLKDNYKFFDYASYCVLDNNFSAGEFPTNTPTKNLQVTAAHEFFHAVQFAYDAFEDPWFMEGSAAWMEDEVFDSVNDNRQYLLSSQFRKPSEPLDTSRGLSVYGGWGFLRYLTERFDDPGLIKKAWNRVDGSRGGDDDYSLQGLARVVNRLEDFHHVLGDFGAVINEPSAFLSEGAHFPSATKDRFSLGGRGATTGWQRYVLDHTSYAPIEITPRRSTPSNARLKITVDAPARATAPEARVMMVRANGHVGFVRSIKLSRSGAGAVNVPFTRDAVDHIVVSLANTSTAFRRCYSGRTGFSCGGAVPVHDNQKHWFKAGVR
jgi:hypothetical protein